MSDRRLPASARVGRVALIVNDIEEAIGFYRDVVGLGVITREEGEATLGTSEETLLALCEDPGAPSRPRESAGLFHSAFRVPSREALADALTRIRDRWRLTGASDHHVSEALYLDDPEGNGVEIYADRPRDAWPTTEDGRVEMETLPLDLEELASLAGGGDVAPPETTVGHVHFETASLPAARAFYVDGVGFTVRQEMDRALFLAAGDYHHHLGVNVWNARSEPAEGRGLEYVEFLVSDRETLAAVGRRLTDAGVDVASIDAAPAAENDARISESIEMTDPDGISIRVAVQSDSTTSP